ncbi:MAG: Stp1/IreP family PP2C-type Ser/Thr phosphatase [Firmicutes bacterium]|nr:Stp1/IreP family PP2C-type Ser/Thr phosphatase [Bacillota bacterium]
MDVRTATDVGQVRENNEDALWVAASSLVVCDGMGGHVAGEVASSLAAKAIEDFPFSGIDPENEVRAAIQKAQEAILHEAEIHAEYRGMGSTITLALVSEPDSEGRVRLTLGHVGDSRCYIFSHGVLQQLTSDHSVVGELLRQGTITASEARTHPKKHVLTQVLGSPDVEIEIIETELEPGTLILLCTDGLTDLVDDQQIAKTLQGDFYASNLARDLVDLANELGGVDNITVIVAKV